MAIPLLGPLLELLIAGFMYVFGYISNNNVFPLPLSEKEESELLIRLEKGDEEARNILIERNLRLVAHIVKKFDTTGEDIDDLISIGTIGLIKGISTFNRNRNTRLATYAARCIENEILMHLRSIKKNKNDLLLYDPIGADKEGNEITLLDILDTGAEVVAEEVEMLLEEEKLRERIAQLSKREKKVIELRYGLIDGINKTQREISKMLGISRSYVSRIEKKALRKLFSDLNTPGDNKVEPK
ncbi:MAG TPA: RNA polymerase sporulation sigma factor SigK [Bacillota bacterium]|nr:RNA polymerase sporulation sigma factor SigK [Bacillota bacterium]HPT86889.1 RNA polymerase sporulation sigma factor SigK [Bacillota bacterium]